MANHLDEMTDTWFQHFKVATTLAFYSCIAALVLMVHAFVPSIFPTTGSDIFKKIQKILQDRGAL